MFVFQDSSSRFITGLKVHALLFEKCFSSWFSYVLHSKSQATLNLILKIILTSTSLVFCISIVTKFTLVTEVTSSIIQTAEALSSSLVTTSVLGEVNIPTAVTFLAFSARNKRVAIVAIAAFFALLAFVTNLEKKWKVHFIPRSYIGIFAISILRYFTFL